MKISIDRKQLIVAAIGLVICMIVALAGADLFLLFTLAACILIICICFNDIRKNIFLLCFIISFFTFLISGDIVELFSEKTYWMHFSHDATIHAHLCMFISLVCILIGYLSTKNKVLTVTIEGQKSDIVQGIKNSSKIVFYVTFVLLFLEVLSRISFVLTSGYVAYYTSYSSALPMVLQQFGDMAPIALCCFLAMFPTKKEAKIPIILFLIYALGGLIAGQRGALIYRLVFLFGYIVYRNKKDSEEIWIRNRTIVLIVLSIPILIIGLELFGYWRVGEDINFVSVRETIIEFFINIGASSKVIKAGYDYKDQLQGFRFYSLGDTLNYFRFSPLFSWLFNDSIVQGHSAEFAISGHSFDSFISYKMIRNQYLSGEGAGSSYIAVLYADFNITGVVIGSLIYGYVFKKISNLDPNRWITSTMKLYAFMLLIKAPRGSYDAFINGIVNLTFIATLVLIYCIVNARIKIGKTP